VITPTAGISALTDWSALIECKKVLEPVVVTAEDLLKGIIQIENRYDFTTLENIEGWWILSADDKIVDQGALPELDINPHSKKAYNIPYKLPEYSENGAEYWLNIEFRLKNSTQWARRGHCVTASQFKIRKNRLFYCH